MAFALTLSDLQDVATHAAGRSTFATGNSGSNCVNHALNYLTNYHPWSWLERLTTLNLTISTNTVAAPSDFGQLITLRGGTSTTYTFEPTSLDQIMVYRQVPGTVTAPRTFFWALNAASGTAASSTYQFELFPTPGASETAAIQLHYRRAVPSLSAATAKAEIPDLMGPTLISLVRGFTELYELNIGDRTMPLAQAELEQYKARDVMVRGAVVGVSRGTVELMAQCPSDPTRRFYTDVATTV